MQDQGVVICFKFRYMYFITCYQYPRLFYAEIESAFAIECSLWSLIDTHRLVNTIIKVPAAEKPDRSSDQEHAEGDHPHVSEVQQIRHEHLTLQTVEVHNAVKKNVDGRRTTGKN